MWNIEKTHNKCIKNIRLSLIGTFKSGAPHALLKAPYANRYARKYKSNMMKKIILLLFLTFPLTIYADPHYVQALHPYWGGEKNFIKYLETFKGAVNVEVNKYEGSKDPDVGEDWYIYIYIIKKDKPIDFSLNILCHGAKQYEFLTLNKEMDGMKSTKVEGIARIKDIVNSDPVHKNDPAEIINGKIVWSLDSTGGAQGMWFYSQSPPTKRHYELRSENDDVISSSIDGPSCEKE